MDEELEQYMFEDNDNDEDDQWSRPVGILDSIADSTQKDVCWSQHPQQSSSVSVPSRCDHPRTIVHIDVDCFYAQVEMIHNPALRDVPLGVQQKYLVVTCNYVARELGVTKLMAVSEARKKCPHLVLVSGEDLTKYRDMSYKISEFLMKYTPCVERLGFDENFLDVTEMVDQRIRGGTAKTEVHGHVFSPPEPWKPPKPCSCHRRLAVGSQIAADLRSALRAELGITCCAGIAHNKLLAKLGGSCHKPSQQTTVFPCHALSLVRGLPSIRHIPGIGSATSKRLKSLGVETVGDLQSFPTHRLQEEFGSPLATTLHKLAFGVDDSPVVTYCKPQMLSIEDSFRRCSTEKDAVSRLSQLISNLLPRAQQDGRTPHTFRLTVRRVSKGDNRYMHRESRQCNLPSAVAAKINSGQLEMAQKLLVSTAMSLLHKMVDTGQPFHLTLINVALTKLEDPAANSIAAFFTAHSPAPVPHTPPKCLQESASAGVHDIAGSVEDSSDSTADTEWGGGKTAINNAETATDKAETATGKAETATDKAETATDKAETATDNAKTAGKAKTATDNAQTATGKAETAADSAKTATGKAETATDSAKTATDGAKTDDVKRMATDTATMGHFQRIAFDGAATNGAERTVTEDNTSDNRVKRSAMNNAAVEKCGKRKATESAETLTTDCLKRMATENSKTKRKSGGDLTYFFTKKPKMSETMKDLTETVQSVTICKNNSQQRSFQISPDNENYARNSCSPKPHSSQISHQESDAARPITLPPGVDPEVFDHLPADIQQEILQSVPQGNPSCRTSGHDSLVLQHNSSGSDSTERIDKMFHSTTEEPRVVEGDFVQRKNTIFSHTKLKTPESCVTPCVSDQKVLCRANTDDQKRDNSNSDSKTKVEKHSEQKVSCTSAKSDLKAYSSPGCFSPQNKHKNPNIEASNKRLPYSRQTVTLTETCGKNLHQSYNARNSVINSIHSPKMPIPKGVAPDVFSTLPPDIQREVSAEMAMKKHNVIPSSESEQTVGASVRKGMNKSPANSILNYLRKT